MFQAGSPPRLVPTFDHAYLYMRQTGKNFPLLTDPAGQQRCIETDIFSGLENFVTFLEISIGSRCRGIDNCLTRKKKVYNRKEQFT